MGILKQIGTKTAIWIKQINNANTPETLYSKVTERVPFSARKQRSKRRSQTDLVVGATSTTNKTQITLITSQSKKLKGIQSDDTVIWDNLAYTVVDVVEAESTLSLYGSNLIIYLER